MLRTSLVSGGLYLAVTVPALAQQSQGWLGGLMGRAGGSDRASQVRPPISLGQEVSHSGQGPSSAPHAVPEIDASSGFLSVAAIATVLLFVWERQRRKSS